MSNQSQVVNTNSEATTGDTSHRSQEFARMNGVEIPNSSETSSPVDEQKTEPEEIVTTRPVANHPLLKGLTVSGSVLLIVVMFGTMISSITGALNSPGDKPAQQYAKSIQTDIKSDDENEKGDLKTAIALTSQKGELQAVTKKNAETAPPTPTIIPTATATPTPTVKTQPTPTRPLTIHQAPPPPTVTRPSRSDRVAAQPVVRQSVSALIPKPVKSQVVSNPLPVRTTPKDPMQEWLAAANVGNYSSTDTGNADLNQEEAELGNVQVNGGIGIKPDSLPRSDRNSSPQLPLTNYDGKRVLVGTRAAGVIETPVAWVGSGVSNQQQQNSLIRLTQPLKAFDGSEVLPKDAYVVAMINPTNSEIVQMTAVSVLVNINGKTEEKPLPQNSILILGKNGNLLKAESRQGGSNLGNSLMASMLSGLSKVAEIQNRANSETTIGSLGTTTTTTSNSDKNLLAGFTEGSINQILSRMKNSNEQQLQQVQQQQQVFVIETGKPVQIFVNQSISI
ncbi:MAG: TrbI/VirB10 family protein [Nostoc sp. DedSLP03]|uniref:TrbI/VirB10 family protein n=1 Tax=Nostoc sp. DedSLP03 TaxID=3075400 RepID=UPI002AD58C20|nr:TrbI/VirB10 family protein [Nostoc sp. DedSLP03]MDZ7966395.1 TrbI/VirB10 family protein [Nostoc sp. DedSLP03]